MDPAVLSWDLGAGESEAISHALGHPGSVAVLDDRKARHCAKKIGIQVKGTVGLLLWLKKEGKLDRVKPVLLSLSRSGFRLDPEVFKLALRLAGELEGEKGGVGPWAGEAPAVYKTPGPKAKKRKKR